MTDTPTAVAPIATPEPGTVTNEVLGHAADAATSVSNIIQAKAHNDPEGVQTAESAFLQSLMAIGEEEVISFIGRMVKVEAKHGFGLETLITGIAHRIGNIF